MLFGKIPLSKDMLNIVVSNRLYGFLKNDHAYTVTVSNYYTF